jgi:hypothetical protein
MSSRAFHVAIAVVLCCATAATAQWATNATTNHIYNTNAGGWVGIGTSAPADKLHVANGSIILDMGATAKGRLTSVVQNWFGLTLNAKITNGYWHLDDTSKPGWFVKADSRTNTEQFAVWYIPSGTNPRTNEYSVYLVDAAGNSTTRGNIFAGGNISANGTIYAKFQDVAEWVPSRETLSAGMLVVLDRERTNHVVASRQAYDTAIAGVVSPEPGLVLGEGGDGRYTIATTGRVRVRVDATRSAIAIGDLLVASDVPGTAQRSTPVDIGGATFHRPGTIVGKALEPLKGGTGDILVLLSLQ